MQRNIYLVGFMGAGKSHVGRKLSRFLQQPLVDLDASIVDKASKSINAIFADQGEAYFRILERQQLHETAFLPPSIISTGGGTPCFFDNMAWMNSQGTCIFLDVPIPILAKRLWKGRLKRPLIQSLTQEQLPLFIERKLRARQSYYQQAEVHFQIQTEDQDVAGDLYRQLNYIVGH